MPMPGASVKTAASEVRERSAPVRMLRMRSVSSFQLFQVEFSACRLFFFRHDAIPLQMLRAMSFHGLPAHSMSRFMPPPR